MIFRLVKRKTTDDVETESTWTRQALHYTMDLVFLY
ncbi:hypothetical protein QFZ80_000001 [Paenibacillus sp. V4I7]|nr:hypothetical protein [Paenibacillus sp. V4I7]